MSNKSTKKALLTSILALVLCMSMLIGTTFAWFTDSATTGGITIQSGKLDVDLEYKNADGEWVTAQGTTLSFIDLDGGTTLWEPGCTYKLPELRVVNNGNLDLKYEIVISGLTGDAKLLEVIDWTVTSGGVTSELVVSYKGNLAAYTQGDAFVIEGHMQETAGNEYMDKSITDISISVYATQLNAEMDSYGPDYDKDAWHPDMTVYTEQDLHAALTHGGDIALGADIVLSDAWAPVGTSEEPFTGVLDGNGHTISGLEISGTDNAALIAYAGDNVTVRNLNLENVSIDSTKYAAGLVCNAGTGLVVENVTVSGTINATSYAAGLVFDADQVTIKNCENNATVTAGRASGIASWISNATVENVVNNGDISGTYSAAGIANRFSGTMKHATNNGKITGNGTEATGGIVGIQLGAASTYEYCVNNGDVTTTADNANSSAAGILAQTPSKAATLNYCINTGKITAEQSYAAGIAYSLYGNITANYCYNSGDVYGGDAAGGITPKAQYGKGDKANHCVVDATVTSAGAVYAICNNVVNSYYYAGDELYNMSGAVVTAKNALKALNEVTGGVFYKVVEGRLEASLEYTWIGDVKATPATVQDLINAADAGDVIVLTAGKYHDTIVMKSGITLLGEEGAIVDCISLNGASNVTLKGITFDAAGAKLGYDGSGNAKQYANIIGRTKDALTIDGGSNIVIEDCIFTGEFANGGVCVAFTDQKRGTYSNITIKGCTFETTNRYYDIYAHYSGGGYLVIEGNTFDSEVSAGIPAGVKVYNIYLGRYQSSTPVVVTGNTFENHTSFEDVAYLQDHGSYGVSFGDTTGNTYNG